MRKIMLFSLCFFLAWCSLNNNRWEEYATSLQKIYQQFSKREKEYPKLPQTTKENKVMREKRNSWVRLRINTYIEHIHQPENEDKSFLYTYLNWIFNGWIYNISNSDLYPLKSILSQITSWTISFEMKISEPISAWAIMGCAESPEKALSYTIILVATGEKEKQEIYTLKNDREWHWTNKEASIQYGMQLTGYWVKGNLTLQWYNFDDISMDENVLVSYCKDNNQVQYPYDNNYQGRQLPHEVIKTFSELAKNNEWVKAWELITFLDKFSIDPTPFWWKYTQIINSSDIKITKDWILSLSYMWDGDKRPSGELTWLTYMFTQWQKIYLLYLDIDSEIYSWSTITSIQDFQNQYPQDYKSFMDAINKPVYLD